MKHAAAIAIGYHEGHALPGFQTQQSRLSQGRRRILQRWRLKLLATSALPTQLQRASRSTRGQDARWPQPKSRHRRHCRGGRCARSIERLSKIGTGGHVRQPTSLDRSGGRRLALDASSSEVHRSDGPVTPCSSTGTGDLSRGVRTVLENQDPDFRSAISIGATPAFFAPAVAGQFRLTDGVQKPCRHIGGSRSVGRRNSVSCNSELEESCLPRRPTTPICSRVLPRRYTLPWISATRAGAWPAHRPWPRLLACGCARPLTGPASCGTRERPTPFRPAGGRASRVVL